MEAKLQQLRQKRSQQIQGVKSTTSGATTRDVQLVACRLANRLCFILNVEHSGASGSSSSAGVGEQSVGATTAPKSISAEIAERGGVNAVTLLFRMFEAADKELMTEALTLTVSLIRGCASVTKSPLGEDASSSTPSLTSPLHSSLESHSKVEEGTYEMGSSAPLLPLLKVLHTPTTCRRVAEVRMRRLKTQRLDCVFRDTFPHLRDTIPVEHQFMNVTRKYWAKSLHRFAVGCWPLSWQKSNNLFLANISLLDQEKIRNVGRRKFYSAFYCSSKFVLLAFFF